MFEQMQRESMKQQRQRQKTSYHGRSKKIYRGSDGQFYIYEDSDEDQGLLS